MREGVISSRESSSGKDADEYFDEAKVEKILELADSLQGTTGLASIDVYAHNFIDNCVGFDSLEVGGGGVGWKTFNSDDFDNFHS